MELSEHISLFNHVIRDTVKFSNVDSFGVVHNIQYFYWAEWAREDYIKKFLQSIGKQYGYDYFAVMVVHNDADYFDSLHLGDEFQIYTRVSQIKDTSIIFDNLFVSNGLPIAKLSCVFVCVDPRSRNKVHVPDEFRNYVEQFEKNTF